MIVSICHYFAIYIEHGFVHFINLFILGHFLILPITVIGWRRATHDIITTLIQTPLSSNYALCSEICAGRGRWGVRRSIINNTRYAPKQDRLVYRILPHVVEDEKI